jgi:hypothetical protein
MAISFLLIIADKTVITKIKPFNFVERDIIDYNIGDGKIIGVIENVSLTHYINALQELDSFEYH